MHSAEDIATLRASVAELDWYHTMELAPGVVTPGWFDTRTVVRKVPFPDLDGARCLDVGTFDGFWAFEMERRGAAEVVAIDILDPRRWDWPSGSTQDALNAIGARKAAGKGFEIARDALRSTVVRRERSVYDLDPEQDGVFDVVYLGSLLLHLRDPIGALQRVRDVCKGHLLVVDAIDLGLTVTHPRRPVAWLDGVGRPWWWRPNAAALARMVEAAGFEVVGRARCFMPSGPGQAPQRVRPGALATTAGREAAVRARLGDPHGIVLAKPRSL